MSEVQETTTEAPKAKRASVCSKVFIDADGSESRSAKATTEKLEFRFKSGEVETITRADHNDEIRTCLEWYGISQKYGDAYSAAKGKPEDAQESFLSLKEQLLSGTWVERAEGAGPRPSLVAEAVVAALIASGQTVDETREAAIKKSLEDPATRKGALKDPAIRAQYDLSRAQRATERAAKQIAEHGHSTVGVDSF